MFKQRAPIRTIPPTVADIHWAAGFLEGEGCFASRESPHKKWDVTVLCVDVLAVQVQKEPLERLQRWFGGSLKERQQGIDKRAPVGNVRRNIWCWLLTSSRAIGLMMALYPLMSPWRQEQIKKAILMWRARPLKRHWAHCSRGHEFTEANTRLKKAKDGYRYRMCRTCDGLYRRIETARNRLRKQFGPLYKGDMGLVLNGGIKDSTFPRT